jgi:hypothetical protein
VSFAKEMPKFIETLKPMVFNENGHHNQKQKLTGKAEMH